LPICGLCDWTISIRGSGFARNAYSEIPARQFMNAGFHAAVLLWPTTASRSCCARERVKKLPFITVSDQMRFETSRTIRADHPSLAGHFPDAPIVPGVVILDEVISALVERHKNCQVAGIRAVKFVLPLRPEQQFMICIAAAEEAETEVDFCCRFEDRVIAEGRLE